MNIETVLTAAATTLAATLPAAIIISGHRNARLKAKLCRALNDCIAFHAIEERLATALAQHELDGIKGAGLTAFTVKRLYRTKLRATGVRTPSDEASPLKMKQELERL